MTALFTAVASAYSSDSDLNDNTNGIFLNKASPATNFPYTTMFLVSATPEYDTDVTKPLEEVTFQFNIHSDSFGATEIGDLYGYLTAEFDWKVMTVTGYVNTATIRQSSNLFKDPEDRWVYSVTYRIVLEKT